MTDQQLPVPAARVELEGAPTETPPVRRPLSVALLPLGLVTFVVLAFVIAAWTFLAAAG
ncbi:MAG TPA: hypothetical protein VHR55_00030 [Candidatus Limnocylindria bacterium]|nr:hypothetical protein [Candidatus Limnocylindria bacterium]